MNLKWLQWRKYKEFNFINLTRSDKIVAVSLFFICWTLILPWYVKVDLFGNITKEYLLSTHHILFLVIGSLLFALLGFIFALYGFRRPPGFLYLFSGLLHFINLQMALAYTIEQSTNYDNYSLDFVGNVLLMLGIILVTIGIYRIIKTIKPIDKEQMVELRQTTSEMQKRLDYIKEKKDEW